MELLTVAEAARRLGYQSRSQLYRLLESGALVDYEQIDAGGRRMLAWHLPDGKSLQQAVQALVRPRADKQASGVSMVTDSDLEAWGAWFDANEPAIAAELDRMTEAIEREMEAWGSCPGASSCSTG